MFTFAANIIGCRSKLAVILGCTIALGASGSKAADAPQVPPATIASGKVHWAFQPIHSYPQPQVKDPAWCRGSIDRFVLARLEEHQLEPSPRADKKTLIRRASFDLIGLPPTVAEIEAFEKDDTPDAFAKVVDRLLDSPHYGERWGRYWLDLARYSDDEGNSFLTPAPHAYVYRDWVIRAFNRDMPYNQFLRLQLAGDLIPEPATDYVERLGGLGFQGLGPRFRKGAAGEAKAKADELEDRIDTLSRGLLALTVSCARCHNHKFDPIPTRDYYSLAAAYNGATWSDRRLAAPAIAAAFDRRATEAKAQKARIESWPAEEGRRIGRGELARIDQYLLAAWDIRTQRQQKLNPDERVIARNTSLQPYFLTRVLKVLESDKCSPLLQAWRVTADAARQTGATQPMPMEVPSPVRQKTAEVEAEVVAALNILKHREEPETASAAAAPLDASQEFLLKTLWQAADAPFAVAAADVMGLSTESDRQVLEAEKAELLRLTSATPSDPPLCPSVSGGGDPMHVLVRGNAEVPGEAAPPGFLTILQQDNPPTATGHFTRLDLADAVINPKNPLTARVFVNRVWHYHFGRGIVGTLGNFGARGDLPTHPELLDTLAQQFIESGWSVKWLHRQIMLSSAYQLSSAPNPTNLSRDADNHYLWRFSTRRLDVEAWRDAMLAVSGKLDPQVGGPALDPKEPGEKAPGFPAFIRLRGLFADDPNNGRRTVYCIVSRYAPSLTLTMFDFPEPNVASDHRNVTTIPQQQLFVLNSPFMLAMSRGFANRLQAAAPTDDARVQLAWQLAYARPITPREAERCHEFLTAAAASADKMSPLEELCQAILSSNEFAFLP